MEVPVLMYDSEHWSINRSDNRRIEAAEMRFLILGYTLQASHSIPEFVLRFVYLVGENFSIEN
jgi:hypothetical protein